MFASDGKHVELQWFGCTIKILRKSASISIKFMKSPNKINIVALFKVMVKIDLY